jgi:8-oxo-dGTP pyrophosphatase MutT (NUDIX family)
MSRTTIPRPASTTVVARDHAGEMQVLMLRRSLAASFMPGSYVFPGGAVDAADDSPSCEVRCQESRVEASKRLGIEESADDSSLAHVVAALRECFEECGLWLGTDRPVDAQALAGARRRMLAGEADIGTISAELSLPLATRALAPWSRWVTPIDAPKRFDAVFFVVPAPPNQEATVDDGETTTLLWVSPAQALVLHDDDALPLEFATVQTLQSLRPFVSAAALMAAARRPRTLEAIHPRVARTLAGVRRVLLPRNAGYADVMRLDPEGTGRALLPEDVARQDS